MRTSHSFPEALLLTLLVVPLAWSQGKLRIVTPREGQQVVGKVSVDVERQNEAQSYLVFKIDGKWITAQAGNHFEFDSTKYPDGNLKLTVDYHDATGKRVDSRTVTLKVSNKVAAQNAGLKPQGLVFRHYIAADSTASRVRRFVLAASARADAKTIDEKTHKPSPDDDGSAAAQYAGALDINIALLLRQEVKEVHSDGSAVLKTIVQSGSEQVRESSSGGGQGMMGGGMMGGGPGGEMGGVTGGGMGMGGMGGGATKHVNKPDWLPWHWSPEVGKWTIKTITPSGWPLVVTQRDQWPYRGTQHTFMLADVTPILPDKPVKPGDTWSIPVPRSALPKLYQWTVEEGYKGLDYRLRSVMGTPAPRALVVPNLRSREVYQAIEEQKFVDIQRRRWFMYEQGKDMVEPTTREFLVAHLQSTLHLLPNERVQEKFRKMLREGKPFSWKDDVAKEIIHDLCRQLDQSGGGGTQGGMGMGEGGGMGGGPEAGGMPGMGGAPGAGGTGGDQGAGQEEEDPIKEAKVDIKRNTYFDYEHQRVLRIEDDITIEYITEGGSKGGMGGGMMGAGGMGGMGGEAGGMPGMGGGMPGMGGAGAAGAGGQQQQASTLTKVTYKARIVTDVDAWPTRPTPVWDKIMAKLESGSTRNPTPRETRTAHDYDNVLERWDHLPPPTDPRQPHVR